MTTNTVPAETATNSDNIEGWVEVEPTNTTGETRENETASQNDISR